MIIKFILYNILYFLIKKIVTDKIIPKLIKYVKDKLIKYVAANAIYYIPIASA